MGSKPTLIDYVYHSLQRHIVGGVLQYGSRLPSNQKLAQLFHVSLRTIKTVISRLSDEGYIRTHERATAEVSYQGASRSHHTPREWEEQRQSILDTCDMLICIMPGLFVAGAERCREQDLVELEQLLRQAQGKRYVQQWMQFLQIFYIVLQRLNNPLILDVYVEQSLLSYEVMMAGQTDQYWKAQDIAQQYETFTRIVIQKDHEGIRRCVQDIYREYKHSFLDYLNNPDLAESALALPLFESYRWNVLKGRLHLYAEIARTLVLQIGSGYYREGERLPDINTLCQMHGVSRGVVQRALQALEDMNLVSGEKGKGQRVTAGAADRRAQIVGEPALQKDGMVFLYAMQFVALTCAAVSDLVFDSITSDEINHLEERMEQGKKELAFMPLFQCILRHLSNQTLHHLYHQLDGLMMWGYPFLFIPRDEDAPHNIYERSIRAAALLRTGEREAFCRLIEEILWVCLRIMKDPMIRVGIAHADQVWIREDFRLEVKTKPSKE